MVKINFHYSPDVSFSQMIGYEMASLIWGQLFTDDINVNILATSTNQLGKNVIGGATPQFHEQHYALFLQYFEADITSAEDQQAFEALQQGNTVDFLLDGDLVSGNTKIKLTTALAKALGMDEAISLDRYVLSDNPLDGTIMMNQNFTWDFDYTREGEAAENTLDFLSVALHETGHILGFTSSLDFSLGQETLYSGRTELSNFSPLDLFRFSAESLGIQNPDGMVNDLSIGGVAWFSNDGGETLAAKMSTGKEGDGYQASHWERRYDPLGIMDPTLWYQERASISDLDVLAFDVLGYDLAENAGDVENLFTSESLTQLLAQAKVNLANKLGITVEELEANANVAASDSDLIAQIEAAVASGNITTPEVSNPLDVSEPPNEKEVKDFIKDLADVMEDAHKDWSEQQDHSDHSDNGSSFSDNFYEWWSQNSAGKNSSWQELYEWWAQSSAGKNSSWQELYEWWAQGSAGKNSSWQELYEWWAQGSAGKNSSWQELYEWWAQGSAGKNSWWQEVFYASADGNGKGKGKQNNLDQGSLPGSNDNSNVKYEKVNGGNEDDIIAGDTTDEEIKGKKGDDLIDGAAGNDIIDGGEGFDTIFGFDGNDSINGGDGDDLISGESDQDVLLGEAGSDVLMGGEQDDYLDGGTGRDFLNGNTGHDALIGRSGNDALEGEAGKDLLIGGSGQDIGNGGSGDDLIFGDQYSDSLQKAFGTNVNSLISLFTPGEEIESTATSSTETNNVVLGLDPLKVEAENMSVSGNYSFAAGGTLVQTNSTARLSTVFSGEAGLYEIVIGYHDVYGNAQITASLGSNTLSQWNLNESSGTSITPSSSNFKTKTIASEVSLNGGESLVLDTIAYATGGGDDDDDGFVNDKAYIDYVEFVPIVDNTNNLVLDPDPNVTDPNTTDTTTTDTTNTTEVTLDTDGDILRGGNGNDGIDGGYGNDIIFGENEYNNSSNIAPINIDNSFNYKQSTYVLTPKAMTWSEAQAYAESLGGNLVTINDAAEEKWLNDTFGTQTFHTGLTSSQQWISGEELTYTYKSPYLYSVETKRLSTIETTRFFTTNIKTLSTQTTKSPTQFGIIEIDWSSVGGNDTVFGGAGSDQIYGNSGNDLLYGDYAENNGTKAHTVTQTTSETLSFQQGVNGYNGTIDTQLHGYYWTTNYGNATSLGVDSNDSGYPVQSVMKFDDIFGSQQGQIASDSTIESAILELNVSDPGSSFKVHEMLKTWSESNTYRNWGNGIQANGVEAKSTAVATTGWVSNGILRIDVTESLQAWQANPTSNKGWAFLPTGSDGVDFSSSEGGNAPRLVVDVTQQTSVSDSTVGEGDDKITGNGGNDTIYGGAGDDILEGTDEIVAGYYENDVLVGGSGADKFILGNQQQAYYATGGYQDYAVIEDFNSSEDTIQFYGSAANYQSQQQGSDMLVSRNGDLVVILENTKVLDLNGSAFEYVNAI